MSRTYSNISEEQEEEDADDDKEESENDVHESQSDVEESRNDDDQDDIPSPYSSAPPSNVSSVQSVQSVSKKKKRASTQSQSQTESLPQILKEYITDRKRSRLEKQTQLTKSADIHDNPIIDFFINMGKTAATFPPLWQAIVKTNVFEIVNRYETELLSGTSPALPPPTPLRYNKTGAQPSQPTPLPTHPSLNSSHLDSYALPTASPIHYQTPTQRQPPGTPSIYPSSSTSRSDSSDQRPQDSTSNYYSKFTSHILPDPN